MKKKIKFWLMIVSCMGLVILFPIFMDIFILGNDIPSNISNSDWASFIDVMNPSFEGSDRESEL